MFALTWYSSKAIGLAPKPLGHGVPVNASRPLQPELTYRQSRDDCRADSDGIRSSQQLMFGLGLVVPGSSQRHGWGSADAPPDRRSSDARIYDSRILRSGGHRRSALGLASGGCSNRGLQPEGRHRHCRCRSTSRRRRPQPCRRLSVYPGARGSVLMDLPAIWPCTSRSRTVGTRVSRSQPRKDSSSLSWPSGIPLL